MDDLFCFWEDLSGSDLKMSLVLQSQIIRQKAPEVGILTEKAWSPLVLNWDHGCI